VLVGGAVWLWWLQAAHDQRAVEVDRARRIARLGQAVEGALDQAAGDATRLGQALIRLRVLNDESFGREVDRLLGAVQEGTAYRAVAWTSDKWIVQYVRAAGSEPALVNGRDLCVEPAWAGGLEQATKARAPAVAELAVTGGDRIDLLFVAPAWPGEGKESPYLGSVVARLDVGRLLVPILEEAVQAGYDADVHAGRTKLLHRGNVIREGDETVDGRAVRALDEHVRLRLRPTERAVARVGGSRATAVLLAGLAVAVAMSYGVGSALRRRWEAVVEAGRQVGAMTSMMQAAGVITASPAAGPEALGRLAASVRELLGARLVTVLVLDEAERRVNVVVRSGEAGQAPRNSYTLEEARATRECLRTGEIVAVEDAEYDARVNRAVLRENAVRGALFVPLAVEKEVIGAMFVGDARPRSFTDAERHLARVLGSQAAVVLASLRLNEQKDRALAAQQEMARRHEALYQIATEIFRSADLDESLQRLADAAPAVIGVDLCLVSLRVGREDTRVAAITGNFANVRGERNTARNSNAGRVWAMKRPLVIEDGPNDPTLHPAYRHRLHVGSVMYLPLLGTDGEPIGTMVLIRHAPGAFRPEQVELAEVLAQRAAQAIETARLHDEARRAAQTHEMLLRELNHRVKNNLASIVGLLALDRPDMPADALAWLTRVSERVSTMARTHELFVGGTDRVELKELVAKLMPALSLIRPPGADIRTDLDGVEVELGTERAVALAMVLNELCWNALEHGTGQGGILWIRGYGLPDNRLALEVEDDGRGEQPPGAGSDPPAAGEQAAAPRTVTAPSGRGTGLRLVEGLVSRELRGRFVMRRTASGGMLARVEIPLEDGEAAGLSL
jgi:two-component sensor histidine kinase